MKEKVIKKFDRLNTQSNRYLIMAGVSGLIFVNCILKAYKCRQDLISLFKEVVNEKGE